MDLFNKALTTTPLNLFIFAQSNSCTNQTIKNEKYFLHFININQFIAL